MRSLGRFSSSLTNATITGVIAAAIHVPLIQSCEVTAAADAEAALAITSVRAFSRRWRSSSLSRVRGGEAIARNIRAASRGRVRRGWPGRGRASADVVVIGAGLAGLTAAREVATAGTSVVVVEARDRVGGRVLNEDIGGGNVVEVGGQWIGPTQDRLAALAAELGVETFPT